MELVPRKNLELMSKSENVQNVRSGSRSENFTGLTKMFNQKIGCSNISRREFALFRNYYYFLVAANIVPVAKIFLELQNLLYSRAGQYLIYFKSRTAEYMIGLRTKF